MASRGGLSKREYAKAQAAKSTKISTPVRKSSTSSSSKSTTPAGAIGQNRDGSYIYANGSSQNYTPVNANYTSAKTGQAAYAPDPTVKSSSKSSGGSSNKSSSSKPKTVKSTAAKFAEGGFSASGLEQGQGTTKVGRLVQIANDPGGFAKKFGATPFSEQIKDKLGLSGVDISGLLSEKLGLGIDSLLRTPVAEASGDPEDIAKQNLLELTGGAIKDIAGIGSPNTTRDASPTAPSNQGRPTNYTPANYSPSSYSPSSGRTPRPVSAPFTPAPSTNISPEIPASFEPQDFSPVSQSQPGTQRRFVGNGNFSNGQFNNGEGNYGVQGTLTGTEGNVNPLEDLLQSLLGSKAEAAGMPQASFDQNASFAPQASFSPQVASFAPQNSMNSYQNSFGALNNIQRQTAPNFQSNISSAPSTQDLPQTTPTPAPRMNGGGVAQQFAQGATGGNPLTNYYTQQEKGYSAQEKAQKRALNELLKSIKKQYSTQEKTGTTALEKSRQEDLLKLSGLFSFANQDPNSEQRIQYEQRANQDYSKQLADFLAQISDQRGQAVSQAKQGYQGKLADIAQQKNATSLELAKLQQALQEAAAKRSGRSAVASAPSSKKTWVDPATGDIYEYQG